MFHFVHKLSCSMSVFVLAPVILMGWSSPCLAQNKGSSKAKTNKPKQLKPRLRPTLSVTKTKKVSLPSLVTYGKVVSFSTLVKRAIQKNSTLVRMRHRVRVFQAQEKKRGAWPDLQVGIQLVNFPLPTFNPGATAMSGIQYNLSQKFPILRRLGLERKFAKLTTAMMREDVKEQEVWVKYRILEAIAWMSYYKEAISTDKELFLLTRQAAEVARAKYAVGKGSQQNLLQALTVQAQIRNQMLGLVAQERTQRYKLARLLGLPGLFQQDVTAVKLAPSKLKPKALLSLSQKNRGSMLRWNIAARQARTLLHLAKVRYWPDVSVQLGIRQRFPNPVDSGNPFLTVGVKVALPTWGNTARYAWVKEAMARHQLARKQQIETLARIKENIQLVLTQVRLYDQQIQVFQQQVLPLALQTYRSALSSYQVDRVDFLNLLASLQTLFKEKLKVIRLQTKRTIALARLKAITGK